MNNVLIRAAALLVAVLALLVGPAATAMEAPGASTVASASAVTLIDINTASAPMLAAGVNGIGKRKSEDIVAYREAHGPFASVDELLEVNGIGRKLLERIRPYVTVSTPLVTDAPPTEASAPNTGL